MTTQVKISVKHVEYHPNHSNVCFNFYGFGNDHVIFSNAITAFCKKYNGQDNLYVNVYSFKYDRTSRILGPQMGNTGGTVTFHGHSCAHVDVMKEFLQLIGHSE